MIESLGIIVGATASCYLALFLARFVWHAPQFIVALFTDAEVWHVSVSGLLPRVFLLPPTEGPAFVFGVYAAGSLFTAVALFAGVWPLLPRVAGWGRVVLVFSMFWTSLLVGESVVSWTWRGRGSFAGAMSVLGFDAFGTATVPYIVAVVTGLSLLVSLAYAVRSLGDGSDQTFLRRFSRYGAWFALPLVLLVLTPAGAAYGRWLRWAGIPHLPLLFAGVIVLVALLLPARQQGRPFRARSRGALLVISISAITMAGTFALPSLQRRWEAAPFDRLTTRHWQLYFEEGALTRTEQQRWGERADQRIEAIAQRLNVPLVVGPLRAFVYGSAESKRAAAAGGWSDEPFSLDEDGSAIHVLLQPDGEMPDPRAEALLLARSVWGETDFPALAEAVARYGVGAFHHSDLASYARKIACEERPYPLQEVLGLQGEYLSPLVRDAMAGAWVESMALANGGDSIKALYQAASDAASIAASLGSSWPEIEKSWHTFLAGPEDCAGVLAAAEKKPADSQRHRGISFSHEYGAAWGYGSRLSDEQLERIHDLGANTIAIVPYAFTRAPQRTELHFRTDETDARVIGTIQYAKQLGLRTMLKPHLWTGRFTGDIAFTKQADFEHWFSQYRRWLLHFARLAELYDVELLAIGNELGGLTSHEQSWRLLVRDIRRIYAGPLTYASNWGQEFETLAFWDDLDFLGVNFYYPIAALGEAPQAHSPQVQSIVDDIASVALRFGKPVLFTEVGFPSVRTAGAEPWRETSAGIDLDLQRECYETVFQAFWGKPWLAGMYWWKWPSHGRGGPYDASFTPTGKPALDVLQRWYQAEDQFLSEQLGVAKHPHSAAQAR